MIANLSYDKQNTENVTSKTDYISLAEAQILAREINTKIEERRKKARLTAAEYWNFLDDE